MMRLWTRVRWSVSTLPLLFVLAAAPSARARSNGVAALGCDSCHSGGKTPSVTLTVEPSSPGLEQSVTLTIKVSQANGATAGFFLTTAFDAPGAFAAIDSGTVAGSSGVMQAMPRAGSGGQTTFTTRWTASRPTGVSFDVFALSANGDRSNRGDGAGAASLDLTIGCTGDVYYIDQDGDGYGSDDPVYRTRKDCAPPPGYAARAGDCDDFRSAVHPGALEQCDQRDNDCNGEVDDDVVIQPFCEDLDGDGHGVSGRATVMDCKPVPGFGACDGDCDDRNSDFFPGATEVCDGRDNDCDGEVDEGVRPVCGVGLCVRRGEGCGAECIPGAPSEETCNGFDDDCDGVVDNGSGAALCGAPGAACVDGRCAELPSGGEAGSAAGSPPVAPSEPSAPSAPSSRPASCALGAGRGGDYSLFALSLAVIGFRRGRKGRA